MNSNYKQKYLKYKQKYLQLKKQYESTYGGFVDYNRYEVIVPEFKNLTNPNFVSDKPRNVNTITIQGVDATSNDYELLQKIIFKNKHYILDKLNPNVVEFMNLLEANSNKIIEIKGFFNINTDYNNNLDEGTYVQSSDFPEVFKSDSGIVPKIGMDKNKNKIEGFFASKGLGKKNLNKVMKKYKEKGVKYVMLEEAGGPELVELYQKYGFTILLSGYDFYLGDEYIGPSTNSIMFENIDKIIEKTN